LAYTDTGDDSIGEDPTVKKLEVYAANLCGYESGLFCCSGTMSTLVALLTHCGRGDEYIVGDRSHNYKNRCDGPSVLGGVIAHSVTQNDDGSMDIEKISNAIKPFTDFFSRTRLVLLENTCHGKILPPEFVHQVRDLCSEVGLILHCDAGRIFHAAVALGVSLEQLLVCFDTASIDLSKGLGAPMGSILMGSNTFISEARRWRKIVGGAMRQSGIMAAIGLKALEPDRIALLARDHENALILAQGFKELQFCKLSYVATNQVEVYIHPLYVELFFRTLSVNYFVVTKSNPVLFYLHNDIKKKDIEALVKCLKKTPVEVELEWEDVTQT